jgi:hypothetical protein
VKFAPAFGTASEADRSRLRSFLSQHAGELLLRVNDSIQDDFSSEWNVVEMDVWTSPDKPIAVLGEAPYVSIGYDREISPIADCGHCFRQVASPSPDFEGFAFGCSACGYLVPNPTYPTWIQADRARQGPARQLLNRLRAALSEISATDPRTVVLGMLISRLPKHFDGSLDWRALDEVASRVLGNATDEPLHATPEEVLSRLPISKYVNRSVGEEGKRDDDDDEAGEDGRRCEICLDNYVDGALLRTLPCFHRFHVACCDDWLALSKSCPLCKTPVDICEDDQLQRD